MPLSHSRTLHDLDVWTSPGSGEFHEVLRMHLVFRAEYWPPVLGEASRRGPSRGPVAGCVTGRKERLAGRPLLSSAGAGQSGERGCRGSYPLPLCVGWARGSVGQMSAPSLGQITWSCTRSHCGARLCQELAFQPGNSVLAPKLGLGAATLQWVSTPAQPARSGPPAGPAGQGS